MNKTKKNIVKYDDIDWANSNYKLKYVRDDVGFFEISLIHFTVKADDTKPKLKIIFEGVIPSYLVSSKKLHPRFSGVDVEREYNFFMQINDSEYVDWLLNQSISYGDILGEKFLHYVFVGDFIVIDIISGYKPVFKSE